MSSFFGCLFFLLFAGLMFLLMPFVQLTNFLFGGSRKSTNKDRRQDNPQDGQEYGSRSDDTGGKIFKPGEGEYVDFEEID